MLENQYVNNWLQYWQLQGTINPNHIKRGEDWTDISKELVKEFQRVNGIPESGNVDYDTYNRLCPGYVSKHPYFLDVNYFGKFHYKCGQMPYSVGQWFRYGGPDNKKYRNTDCSQMPDIHGVPSSEKHPKLFSDFILDAKLCAVKKSPILANENGRKRKVGSSYYLNPKAFFVSINADKMWYQEYINSTFAKVIISYQGKAVICHIVDVASREPGKFGLSEAAIRHLELETSDEKIHVDFAGDFETCEPCKNREHKPLLSLV